MKSIYTIMMVTILAASPAWAKLTDDQKVELSTLISTVEPEASGSADNVREMAECSKMTREMYKNPGSGEDMMKKQYEIGMCQKRVSEKYQERLRQYREATGETKRNNVYCGLSHECQVNAHEEYLETKYNYLKSLQSKNK